MNEMFLPCRLLELLFLDLYIPIFVKTIHNNLQNLLFVLIIIISRLVDYTDSEIHIDDNHMTFNESIVSLLAIRLKHD